MDIVGIVFALLLFALLGFLCYLMIKYIPMLEPFKDTLPVICVVLIIIYILLVIAGRANLPHLPGLKL